MGARPVVCVADKVSWEDAMLTTVKKPMINYPKYVQSAKEPTNQHKPCLHYGVVGTARHGQILGTRTSFLTAQLFLQCKR